MAKRTTNAAAGETTNTNEGAAAIAAAREALAAFTAAWYKCVYAGLDMPAGYPTELANMTAELAAHLAVMHVEEGAAGQDCTGYEYAKDRYPDAVDHVGDGCAEWWESRAKCFVGLAGYALGMAARCAENSRKADRLAE